MKSGLLIAFAPGSRGFLLAKWLYRNGIIHTPFVPDSVEYRIDGDNHHLIGFYNDVLFSFNDRTRDLFWELQSLLYAPSQDHERVRSILAHSQYPALPSQSTKRNVMFTHHASAAGLQTLSSVLDADVLRITFADWQQLEDSYLRKYQAVTHNHTEYLEREYKEFLQDMDFAININVDRVRDLDLDHVLEILG